jgi:large subunit ribosomal protein L3
MFLIGRKLKMSQVWDEQGKVIPVTILQAGPVTVTQVRTPEKEKYSAVQVGFDATVKRVNKPMQGHLKKVAKEGEEPLKFRYIREFRTKDTGTYEVGKIVSVSEFQKGDKVRITGTEKGRGFQGVVKRHGFHGGPKTHGQKNRLRAPGSLGATAPQRVMPNKPMAGRMGNERVTIRRIPVVQIDAEKNLLYVKGPVPGNNKTIVLIEKM